MEGIAVHDLAHGNIFIKSLIDFDALYKIIRGIFFILKDFKRTNRTLNLETDSKMIIFLHYIFYFQHIIPIKP